MRRRNQLTLDTLALRRDAEDLEAGRCPRCQQPVRQVRRTRYRCDECRRDLYLFRGASVVALPPFEGSA